MIKSKIQKIIFVCFFILLAGNISAARIDLADESMYIRRGFSKEWINTLPEGKDWVRVAPGENGERSIKLKEIGLLPHILRPFLSLKKFKPEEFTYITSFNLSDSDIRNSFWGLYLVRINFNWEIYINGKILISEMFIDDEGWIRKERFTKGMMAAIHPEFLKPRRNIIAFRIIGDPTNSDLGFVYTGPYYIDTYQNIIHDNSEMITIVLIYLYLFVALYHISIFLFNRKNSYYLFYGLFSIMLFIYMAMRINFIFNMFDNSVIAQRIEFSSLYTIIPLMCMFLDRLIRGRLSRFTLFISLYSTLLICATVFVPIPAALDLLTTWQVSAFFQLLYIMYLFIHSIINHVHNFRKEDRSVGKTVRFYTGFKRTLTGTVTGSLLIGISISIFTAVYDILDSMIFQTGVFLTTYGFFFFVIGVTFILAKRFVDFHNKAENLNLKLKSKIAELNLANVRISHSEKKYRFLINGFNDLIFTLDKNFNFILANEATIKQFKLDSGNLVSSNFKHLLFENLNDESMKKQIVQENLEELIKNGKNVVFKTNINSKIINEPQEINVKLQLVDFEGKNEILGRVSFAGEDALTNFIEYEKQRFRISNYLITADEICHRLTRNLIKHLEIRKIGIIRTALREILINAIEHGNLGITFEEKTKSMQEDKYFELLKLRQNDPVNTNKAVTIEYLLDAKRVLYKITDDGKGFDHKGFIRSDASKLDDTMLYHGRGITMARNIFDSIEYNKKGNQVLMIKKFL